MDACLLQKFLAPGDDDDIGFPSLFSSPGVHAWEWFAIPGSMTPMHAFHQLYYHMIWSTHSRVNLVDRAWRTQLLAILNEEVKTRGGWPIRHNAMPDHVHLLVRLPPTVRITEFIGEVKGATSFRVNREIKPSFKLKWQEGYGILSLRKEEVERVSRYIDNQERHHSAGRLSELLERSEIEQDDWPEGP